MRGVVAILVLAAMAFSASGVLAGPARTCWVEPDPVPLHSSFTVYATGLTPNQMYYLNITQAKDPSNNAHPNWSIEIGPDGSGSSVVPSTEWSPDGILTVGEAKVRVYPSTGAAKGTANCAFTVGP